jgi:signal transduction histidine kinase
MNVFPLAADEARGATLLVQDLTERRRIDEQVNRMARLASIGQLAAGIAHEIRNPLTGVGISLDILREGESLSPAGMSLLDDIGREIDRLEALIRGLLDFARPQPAQKRPMRVAKALEWHRTFAEQCGKKGVEFRLDLRENPKIEGDPEKLKQLFLNLALNALEATDEGGEVRMASDLVHTVTGWCARVTVEDTGRGMDAEIAAQVFNPFFTTKSDGTGLGLAIAHSIAEQHGGRIDLESAPGVGTRFVVDLPSLEHGEE